MQLLRASFEFMSPKRTHGLAERSPAIMALSAGLARSRELYSLKSQQWARMLSAWAARMIGLLPPRLAFLVLVLLEIEQLRGRHLLEKAYRVHVAAMLAQEPDQTF